MISISSARICTVRAIVSALKRSMVNAMPPASKTTSVTYPAVTVRQIVARDLVRVVIPSC